MLNIETRSRVINSSTKSMTQANTCVPPEIGKHGSKARTPIVMAKTTWLVQETQSVALVVDIDIKSSRSTQTIAHCSNNPNSQFWARGAAGAADGGENLRDATSADRPKNLYRSICNRSQEIALSFHFAGQSCRRPFARCVEGSQNGAGTVQPTQQVMRLDSAVGHGEMKQ